MRLRGVTADTIDDYMRKRMSGPKRSQVASIVPVSTKPVDTAASPHREKAEAGSMADSSAYQAILAQRLPVPGLFTKRAQLSGLTRPLATPKKIKTQGTTGVDVMAAKPNQQPGA